MPNSQHPTLFITHRGAMHQQAALQAAPPELVLTMLRDPSKEEIIAHLPGKEFLISERSGLIDAEILAAGKDLRLIQRLGSQTQDIDLDAAQAAGIPVAYLPIRTCIMVAEHLLLQLLMVAKRGREMHAVTASGNPFGHQPTLCDEDTFAYNWSGREDIRGLWQATVGILGMGEIGFELARRLRNFGGQVLYNKRSRLPGHTERELAVTYATQDELVNQSDYVVILLPFFDETKGSVNAAFFERMKPGAALVSSGGSGVIDEEALALALISGRLYGAAVDNYTYEPPLPDNPLLALGRDPSINLFLTPHTAAGTVPKVNRDLRLDDYQNLLRLLQGQELVYRLV